MPQNSPNQKRNIWERMISLASPPVVADYAPSARQVGPNLWVVDRKLRFPSGLTLPTRCTVIRLPNGELFLHSPCELTETTRKNIDALGQVRFLIAPNSFHISLCLPIWLFIRQLSSICHLVLLNGNRHSLPDKSCQIHHLRNGTVCLTRQSLVQPVMSVKSHSFIVKVRP